jgi:hypothetical protein
MKLEDVGLLSMGRWMHQLLATLCVASSLTLVALGSSDPTRRVLPSNPELWQTPQQSCAPFQIRLMYSTMYRACRRRSQMTHKIIFTARFFSRLRSLATLPPQLLHHRVIKLVVAPAQPTSFCTISHRLPTSFPMPKKKRGNIEIDLKE